MKCSLKPEVVKLVRQEVKKVLRHEVKRAVTRELRRLLGAPPLPADLVEAEVPSARDTDPAPESVTEPSPPGDWDTEVPPSTPPSETEAWDPAEVTVL